MTDLSKHISASMRHLFLLALAFTVFSACDSSDGGTLGADDPPECAVASKGNSLIAECSPQRVEVTKQPEDKIREAKVAMIYGFEGITESSGEEGAVMTIVTGSDDWNFDDVDRLYISLDGTDFSGYHDSNQLGLINSENVEKNHHYETNYVELTGEQAILLAEAEKVEIQMGDANFNVSVASDQMEELVKKVGDHVTGN